MITGFLLYFGIILALRMFRYQEVSWNQNLSQNSKVGGTKLVFNEEDKPYVLMGFSIPNYLWNDSYNLSSLIQVLVINETYNKDNTYELSYKRVSWEECTGDKYFKFQESLIETIETLKLQNLAYIVKTAWLDFTGVTLPAVNVINFISQFVIQIYPWFLSLEPDISNATGCLDKDLALSITNSTIFSLGIIQTIIDLNDLNSAFTHKDLLLYDGEIIIGQGIRLQVDASKIELTLEDSLLGYYPPADVITFNRFESNGVFYEGISTFAFSIAFKNNGHETYQYKRKVFNIFELTGILGGIFEVLDIGFGMMISVISSFIFK